MHHHEIPSNLSDSRSHSASEAGRISIFHLPSSPAPTRQGMTRSSKYIIKAEIPQTRPPRISPPPPPIIKRGTIPTRFPWPCSPPPLSSPRRRRRCRPRRRTSWTWRPRSSRTRRRGRGRRSSRPRGRRCPAEWVFYSNIKTKHLMRESEKKWRGGGYGEKLVVPPPLSPTSYSPWWNPRESTRIPPERSTSRRRRRDA